MTDAHAVVVNRGSWSLAWTDIVQGFQSRELWHRLAWQGIRHRYRRSYLGPFWITLAMALLVGILGTLYGQLLQRDLVFYLPYLTAGLLAWQLINDLMVQGGNTFINAEKSMKNIALPLSLYVFQNVALNFYVFLHNIVIFFVVAVIMSIEPSWTWLLAIPAVVLILFNGVWYGLLFGALSTRYRDLPPIITSLLRVAFFLTPVIWSVDMRPQRDLFVEFNPFYHFLEIFRAPLLGSAPSWTSYAVTIGISLFGSVLAIAVFRKRRSQIVFWL